MQNQAFFLVQGVQFKPQLSLFEGFKGTVLFDLAWKVEKPVVIHRDPALFRIVLNYCKSGVDCLKFVDVESLGLKLKQEAEFYQIDALVNDLNPCVDCGVFFTTSRRRGCSNEMQKYLHRSEFDYQFVLSTLGLENVIAEKLLSTMENCFSRCDPRSLSLKPFRLYFQHHFTDVEDENSIITFLDAQNIRNLCDYLEFFKLKNGNLIFRIHSQYMRLRQFSLPRSQFKSVKKHFFEDKENIFRVSDISDYVSFRLSFEQNHTILGFCLTNVLPTEVFRIILSYLKSTEILNCACVCKVFSLLQYFPSHLKFYHHRMLSRFIDILPSTKELTCKNVSKISFGFTTTNYNFQIKIRKDRDESVFPPFNNVPPIEFLNKVETLLKFLPNVSSLHFLQPDGYCFGSFADPMISNLFLQRVFAIRPNINCLNLEFLNHEDDPYNGISKFKDLQTLCMPSIRIEQSMWLLGMKQLLDLRLSISVPQVSRPFFMTEFNNCVSTLTQLKSLKLTFNDPDSNVPPRVIIPEWISCLRSLRNLEKLILESDEMAPIFTTKCVSLLQNLPLTHLSISLCGEILTEFDNQGIEVTTVITTGDDAVKSLCRLKLPLRILNLNCSDITDEGLEDLIAFKDTLQIFGLHSPVVTKWGFEKLLPIQFQKFYTDGDFLEKYAGFLHHCFPSTLLIMDRYSKFCSTYNFYELCECNCTTHDISERCHKYMDEAEM